MAVNEDGKGRVKDSQGRDAYSMDSTKDSLPYMHRMHYPWNGNNRNIHAKTKENCH